MPRIRNHSRVQLQVRDRRVIEYLLKYRVATIYQILKHLALRIHRHHFCQRLNKLVKFGYLVTHWYEQKKVYSLGEKGQSYLLKEMLIPKRYQIQHLGNVMSKTHHDVVLNDVCHEIEKFDFVQKLKTHNELLIADESYSKRRNISDGIMVLTGADGSEVPVALEVELSPKKKSNYSELFYGYAKCRSLPLVIYLVEKVALRRLLIEFAEKYSKCDQDKFYVGMIDEFFKDPGNCELISNGKKRFLFKELPTSNPVQLFR